MPQKTLIISNTFSDHLTAEENILSFRRSHEGIDRFIGLASPRGKQIQ